MFSTQATFFLIRGRGNTVGDLRYRCRVSWQADFWYRGALGTAGKFLVDGGRGRKVSGKERIVAGLRDFFARTEVADAAYIFGSVASGRDGERSDVDVAVIFRAQTLSREERVWRRVDLAEQLAELLVRPVDIVDLETCSPVVAHQVLSRGQIIFEQNRPRRLLAEIRQRRLYRDEAAYNQRRYERTERFFREV